MAPIGMDGRHRTISTVRHRSIEEYDRRMRRLALPLIVAMGLTILVPPLVTGAASPCRVRNVDQGTNGGSLKAMAASANDGDRLRVRGVCRGEVVVTNDITIRGVGDTPTVTGQGIRRVFRVQPGATVTIKQLRIRDGRAPSSAGLRGGGGIRNRGELTLLDSTVRDSRAGGGGLGGGDPQPRRPDRRRLHDPRQPGVPRRRHRQPPTRRERSPAAS